MFHENWTCFLTSGHPIKTFKCIEWYIVCLLNSLHTVKLGDSEQPGKSELFSNDQFVSTFEQPCLEPAMAICLLASVKNKTKHFVKKELLFRLHE